MCVIEATTAGFVFSFTRYRHVCLRTDLSVRLATKSGCCPHHALFVNVFNILSRGKMALSVHAQVCTATLGAALLLSLLRRRCSIAPSAQPDGRISSAGALIPSGADGGHLTVLFTTHLLTAILGPAICSEDKSQIIVGGRKLWLPPPFLLPPPFPGLQRRAMLLLSLEVNQIPIFGISSHQICRDMQLYFFVSTMLIFVPILSSFRLTGDRLQRLGCGIYQSVVGQVAACRPAAAHRYGPWFVACWCHVLHAGSVVRKWSTSSI